MRFYNNKLLAINLCRIALGGQTVKKLSYVYLRPNLRSTKVNASPRKSSQVDDMQVVASRWYASRRKLVAKRNSSWTQVQNLRLLASPFGQGFSRNYAIQLVDSIETLLYVLLL